MTGAVEDTEPDRVEMPEVTTLAEIENIARAWEHARGGMLPVDRVLDAVVNPLLRMLAAGAAWCTFSEALDALARSKSFLTAPLAELDNRSRLEDWQDRGLARQTSGGQWLISELALKTVSVERDEEPEPATGPRSSALRLLDTA